MAAIRGRDTKPELIIRKGLHARGFRFRLHGRDLPGRPDLIFPKYRVLIWVHGCFWHRHRDCRLASTPASNSGFWADKFARNVERDRQATEALRNKGWRVATVWECGLRRKDISFVIEQTKQWLLSDNPQIELP